MATVEDVEAVVRQRSFRRGHAAGEGTVAAPSTDLRRLSAAS